jgi:peptidoglycan/xylan/chitin deacetylase (PgdA/CDA1 family)
MRNGFIIFLLVLFSHSLILTQGKSQEQKQKPWEWTLEEIRSKVDRVRAGRDLTPYTWPKQAKVAVGISFDFDAETNALRDNNFSPGTFSQGEYAARAGIPRILNLLDKHEIPATFFVPAVSALLHSKEIGAIMAKGIHEIGIHGWIHERNSTLTEAEERDLLKKSFSTLKIIMGKSPVGIRTPSWDFSLATIKIIQELGLLYDSSLMADDRPYEILENGKPTGIVELPVEWILDDYPYFGFSRYSSIRPQISPMDVYSIWAGEFDRAYEERTMIILTLHPKYIGHRSRIDMLDKLIEYMKTKEGVWFATHEAIARYVRWKRIQSSSGGLK